MCVCVCGFCGCCVVTLAWGWLAAVAVCVCVCLVLIWVWTSPLPEEWLWPFHGNKTLTAIQTRTHKGWQCQNCAFIVQIGNGFLGYFLVLILARSICRKWIFRLLLGGGLMQIILDFKNPKRICFAGSHSHPPSEEKQPPGVVVGSPTTGSVPLLLSKMCPAGDYCQQHPLWGSHLTSRKHVHGHRCSTIIPQGCIEHWITHIADL